MSDVTAPMQTVTRRESGTPAWLFSLAAGVPLAILAGVAAQSPEMQALVFRDVYSATLAAKPYHFPPLLGLVSNIGIICWCVAWAISGFAALVLLRRGARRDALFLLCLSLMSGLFMADDFFLLHELVFPLIGLREVTLFPLYGCLVFLLAYTFRSTTARVGRGLLYVAIVLFAASVAGDFLDNLEHDLGGLQRWLEDAPKLMGVSFWMAFALRAGWILLEVDRDRPLHG